MKLLWFSTSLARRFRPYVPRVNYKQRWFGNPDQMTREPTREVIRILKIQTSSPVLQLIKLPTSCCAYRSHLPAKIILDLKNQVQYMLKQFKITKWILKIDTLCLFFLLIEWTSHGLIWKYLHIKVSKNLVVYEKANVPTNLVKCPILETNRKYPILGR